MLINFLKQVKMAIDLKKKKGRPAKKKNDDFATPEDLVTAKNEIIADLEARLDSAYKEQEKMLKELDKCIYATIHHCDQVESNTGSITLHDVDYCIDMIKRIMKHKFEYKPKSFEQ
jgi:hypothetical protein